MSHSRSQSRHLSFRHCTNLAHHRTFVVAVVPLSDILGKRTLVSDVEVAVAPTEREAGKSAMPAYAGFPTRVRSGPLGPGACGLGLRPRA